MYLFKNRLYNILSYKYTISFKIIFINERFFRIDISKVKPKTCKYINRLATLGSFS